MNQHVVQLYGSDDVLIGAVTRVLRPSLAIDQTAFIFASGSHYPQLANSLARVHDGFITLPRLQQCALPDAPAACNAVMIDGWPAGMRFADFIDGALCINTGSGPVRLAVFEAIGPLPWEQVTAAAAFRLEQIWHALVRNGLLSTRRVYPVLALPDAADCHHLTCRHDARAPAGIRTGLIFGTDHLHNRATMLEQHAKSLEDELERRTQTEQVLRQQLADLAEKDRRKDEFMAMLGHELRNPLAPISVSIKLMRLHQNDGTSSTQWLDIIERQSLRMKRLVDDLLDVSRIQLGKLALHKQLVRLDAVIDGAVEMVSPMLETLQHQLTVASPAEPIHLYGDLDRLEQALANLLQNAAKYTGKAGRIRLHAYLEQAELVLSVSDNGSGLSRETRQNAFDLFQQGESTLAHAHGGLGVGLALVRQIIELHGGSVHANSDGPGRGSEFVIRLPRNYPVN